MRPKETREPERTLPLGLILAMAGAAVLYIAVAITAVSIVPWRALAAVFTVITLFAVANTALINYITASRLIYGIARQGLLPARLGTVHSSRRTPHLAIGLLLLVLMLLALLGTIAELAAATVLTLLVVFIMVNGALLILQDRTGERPGHFEVPRLVPALGALVCFVLIVVRVGTGDWGAPRWLARCYSPRSPSMPRCGCGPNSGFRSAGAADGADHRDGSDGAHT